MKVLAVVFACFQVAYADLRMASQPKRGFKVNHMSRRRQVRFNTSHALYMEPSDFAYVGLMKQRDGNGYDNFLRSNIDNQQDRRNFEYENGRDHLPFRSWEAFTTDSHKSQKHKIPKDFPGTNITATPGQPVHVPLRWNNPHASELEVNAWIMQNKYVVPVRKPSCSGEGYQDNAFTFTIPKDFNELGSKVPGFKGCTAIGECVLQIYAHSVESRTYSIGSPLIVAGYNPSIHKTTAGDLRHIAAHGTDPGMDFSKLRDLCRPSNDPEANIKTSKPQHARYVSDQYNHAYQNSDFSPYSGQQPDEISKNMQASVVVKMVPGNRGELGKRALLKDNPKGFRFQRQLDRKAKRLVKKYEDLANSLIKLIGGKMKNTDLIGPAMNHAGEMKLQQTEECFRCATVGSTTTRRLETTTYIPSFKIPQELLSAVKVLITDEYKSLINETSGLVEIYVATVRDLSEEFKKAYALNITYQGPMVKPYMSTMEDDTHFKKTDANGEFGDHGLYAARQAYKKYGGPPWSSRRIEYANSLSGQPSPMAAVLAKDFPMGGSFSLPKSAPGVSEITAQFDPSSLMADGICDDPDTPNVDTIDCPEPTEQLFFPGIDIEAEVLGLPQSLGGGGMVTDGSHNVGVRFALVMSLALLHISSHTLL